MTEGEGDQYTPPQFREYQEGHGVRDPDVDAHAGLVRDPQLSRFLSVLHAEYEPQATESDLPGVADDLAVARRMQRLEATDVAREALENGDTPTLKHMTGDSGQRADLSGMQALTSLQDRVAKAALLWYIFAPPGSGKTDFALLSGQLWQRAHPDGEVATNIKTLREADEWIANYPDVMEWFKQDQQAILDGEGTPKLFIFDEASSHASGRGKSGAKAGEKLAPLVYKVRKYGGSIIIVGHDGRDVHPAIRVMATAVQKEDKKRVSFYETVKNRKGRGHQLSLEGVPPTDWRYNDKEATSWAWEETGDDGETLPDPGDAAYNVALWTVKHCKEEGLSDRETAKYIPYSKTWVNNRWGEIEAGEHREALDSVEELTG